jgi:hypothetical protein
MNACTCKNLATLQGTLLLLVFDDLADEAHEWLHAAAAPTAAAPSYEHDRQHTCSSGAYATT